VSQQTWVETLATAQVDGPALTAAAAASCLPTASVITLPNNYFYIGRKLRIRASGRISCVVTTPGTARYDVRLGGTVVFDGLAMNLNVVAKTNVNWWLELGLTCRAVGSGSATTFFGQGTWTSEAAVGSPLPTAGGSGVFTLPYNTAPTVGTGVNNQSALSVDLFFTQTVATGSMTLQMYSLESLN
jgi:hypothetical protein